MRKCVVSSLRLGVAFSSRLERFFRRAEQKEVAGSLPRHPRKHLPASSLSHVCLVIAGIMYPAGPVVTELRDFHSEMSTAVSLFSFLPPPLASPPPPRSSSPFPLVSSVRRARVSINPACAQQRDDCYEAIYDFSLHLFQIRRHRWDRRHHRVCVHTLCVSRT